MAIFAKQIKYTVQEGVINTILNWCYNNSRADLALVVLTLAQETEILSATYKVAPKIIKLIEADYPSAFSSNAVINFFVEVE